MANDNRLVVASGSVVNDSDGVPPAERSGPAIVGLLQQAADAARRNEERARAMAQRLSEQVQMLEHRNQVLQEQARDFRDRAVRAEQWLLHIYDEIQIKLIEQSPPIGVTDGSQRR